MKAPLSWLKEFVDITLKPEDLADRLTQVGLGVEKIEKVDGDIIFEFEVTPNRPDLLSILGIAREIAAIENKSVRAKTYQIDVSKKTTLPMKLTPNYDLFPRWTALALANVAVKPSPQWMQERLIKVGLRPINSVVDVTNYLMVELGFPLHAFDYDQLRGQQMAVDQAKGGERFTTVDELTYSLPKGAIIIRDAERIIDLAGIKGGLNSGITEATRNVFLQATIDNPILIRRASQNLSLRSEASAIYERRPDNNGTVLALTQAASLLVGLGAEVASTIYDLKKSDFKPWRVKLRLARLRAILGIEIEAKKVINILSDLCLFPKKVAHDTIQASIPTHRNDLKIEEDLIEEVARLYGYNNFPKTLPNGALPTQQVPYKKEDREVDAKAILHAAGFSEIYTYSLVSETDLSASGVNPNQALRVDNPVSKEYEYLRPTLRPNLVKALVQNLPYAKDIRLFELGKVYQGKTIDERKEIYLLSGIADAMSFLEVKGVLQRLFEELNVADDPTPAIDILPEGIFFEVNFTDLVAKAKPKKKFIPLSKYPPIVEDLAIVASLRHPTGELIKTIRQASPLVANVELLDRFESTRTFHLVYQHRERNLTASDAAKIRKKILRSLKSKFNARPKE